MPDAVRKLGMFMFVVGAVIVVGALAPVMLALVDRRDEQPYMTLGMVGGLVTLCGLALNWLGSQSAPAPTESAPGAEVRPPTLRLSSRLAGQGREEDLMA